MDFDTESEDEGIEELDDNWLETEEPEVEIVKDEKKVVEKVDKVQYKSKYIVENVDLYYALCDVEDLKFENLPDEKQEELMKTIEITTYQPGQLIFEEGALHFDFYIVIATEETFETAEVEIVAGNILAGTEVFLTRLHRGQIFGQKYFISKRKVLIKSLNIIKLNS
jgi:DNA polymerase elongation subunit (family B)